MKQKLYFLFTILLLQNYLLAQTQTLPYYNTIYGQGNVETTLTNLSTCQVKVVAKFSVNTYNGSWSNTGTYDYYVNGNKVGSSSNDSTVDLSAYMPITSVKMVKTNSGSNWGSVFLNLEITSNAIDMPVAPTVTNKLYCLNSVATPLNASLSGTGTTLKWYSSSEGEKYSAVGPTPSTSSIGTTSYWVAQANVSGCESLRSKIDVIIVDKPTVISPVVYTQGDIATALTATTNGTGLVWYTSETGGTGSKTAPIPSTATAGNTTYWVATAVNSDCETARTPIVVTVKPLAPTTSFATQIYTGNDKTLANLQLEGSNIKWYTAAVAGSTLSSSTKLIDETTYYASQTVAGIESVSRVNIKVKRISESAQTFCNESKATVANLVSTPTVGATVKWYTDATGGNALVDTEILKSGSYYIEQASSNRVLVNVTVISLAKPTVKSPFVYYKGDPEVNLLVASGGTGYKGYDTETGGVGTVITEIVTKPIFVGTFTFWVTSTNELGCESERQSIVLTIKDIDTPTTQFPIQIYSGNDKTLANLLVTGTNLQWYDSATAGTELQSNTSLTDGSTYYVSQTVNGFTSPNRLAITVKRISENSQFFDPTKNPTVQNLSTTPIAGGSVKWFSTANGTTALDPSVALASGTYYVEQTNPSVIETIATGIDKSSTSITSVAAQKDGKIIFGEGLGNLYRMNADGSNKETISSSAGTRDILVESDGSLLIADNGNGKLNRMATNGTVTNLSDKFTFIEGIAKQADGKIIIADYQLFTSGAVKRMNADGSNLVTLDTTIDAPWSVAVQADGKILVVDPNVTSIKRMDNDGSNVVSLGSGFKRPEKVLVEADGRILVLDQDDKAIKRMNADGTNITTLKDGFTLPINVNLDAAGAIYVAEAENNTIVKINPTTITNRIPVIVKIITNEDCSTALTLTVNEATDPNPMEVDLTLAKASVGMSNPTCNDKAVSDLWFQVEVPSTGKLRVQTNHIPGERAVDTAMEIYSGTCNEFKSLACNDNVSATQKTSLIELDGLAAGSILFVRAWENLENVSAKNSATNVVLSSRFTISAFSTNSLANESFESKVFTIYPNPTVGEITIDATSLNKPSLKVYDLNGKLILSKELQSSINNINLNSFTTGLYLFKVKSEEGEIVKKIQKI